MHSTPLTSALATEEQKLLACIHCGLCLESCPTYVATGDENDGPRGRLYLMRAVEEGRLASSSTTFERHIDCCLGCRACESVCPAGVEYGRLLEASRAELFTVNSSRGFKYRLLRSALKHVWEHPTRLRLFFAATRLFRNSRIPQLLLKSGLAQLISRRAEFALALVESSAGSQKNESGRFLTSGNEQRQALFFKGCVGEGLFRRVNDATKRVLKANGVRVTAPADQVCCGALHAHAGDLDGARRLARRNIEAFEDERNSSIVTNAGGCGAMLATYGHLLMADGEYGDRARAFSNRVRDISQELDGLPQMQGAPICEHAVTYDASCHLMYGQHASDTSLEMLRSVPGLNFLTLVGYERCCGGAGVYNLLEPDLSAKVLAEKIAHIRESGAKVLATGNAGCQMQIGAGARISGLKLKVCHPVELLDESYRRAGLYE